MEGLETNRVNPFTRHWINWETPIVEAVELINSAEVKANLPLIFICGPKGAGKSTLIGELVSQGKVLAADGDVLQIFAAFRTLQVQFFDESMFSDSEPALQQLAALKSYAEERGDAMTIVNALDFFKSEGKLLWNWDNDWPQYESILLRILMRVQVATLPKLSREGMAQLQELRTLHYAAMVPSYRQYTHVLKKRNEWVQSGSRKSPEVHKALDFKSFIDKINEVHSNLYAPALITKVFTIVLKHLSQAKSQDADPETIQKIDDSDHFVQYHVLPHDYSPGAMRALATFVVTRVFNREFDEKEVTDA